MIGDVSLGKLAKRASSRDGSWIVLDKRIFLRRKFLSQGGGSSRDLNAPFDQLK